MIWAHFASVAVCPMRLHFTGCLNTADIQILATLGCYRYIQVELSGVLLTDDLENCATKDIFSVDR